MLSAIKTQVDRLSAPSSLVDQQVSDRAKKEREKKRLEKQNKAEAAEKREQCDLLLEQLEIKIQESAFEEANQILIKTNRLVDGLCDFTLKLDL